jgi:hypothetical protein
MSTPLGIRGADKNKQLTIIKPTQTGINRNKYFFFILKSLEPLKNSKNQPRPLVRPSSVNVCQNFKIYVMRQSLLSSVPLFVAERQIQMAIINWSSTFNDFLHWILPATEGVATCLGLTVSSWRESTGVNGN